jgi:tripartite-type tricarboxylate transporter receptor subunit TctC
MLRAWGVVGLVRGAAGLAAVAGVLLAAVAAAPLAGAEDYPARTVRVIVPFPPGSSSDVNARQLGKVLSERLRQSVVIENRPGANGIVGTEALARAKPDGYTIGFVTGHVVAVNPHLVKNLSFDPLADFVPVLVTGRSPAILVVSAASPYRSLKDLLEAGRRSPGKLTYGSSGEGSPQFIMAKKLERMAGMEAVHVPYKGETPALQDLMGGSIDFCFGFPAGTLPHLQGGRLRALAVTTPRRLAAFPDIPTVAESGLAGYEESTLGAYLVPRGTPPAIVQRLNTEFRAALEVMRAEFTGRGSEVTGTSSEEAAAQIRAEHARYGKLVVELGLRPQ